MSKNDVYTLCQVLKHKDIKKFVYIIMNEVKAQEEREHWEKVERNDMTKNTLGN